jgi:hypothetical protein
VADITLPPAMIEAAAERLSLEATGYWDGNGEDVRDEYRSLARAVLTAALSTCTIREEWRLDTAYADGNQGYAGWAWRQSRQQVESDAQIWRDHYPDAVVTVEHRLVIETAPERTTP